MDAERVIGAELRIERAKVIPVRRLHRRWFGSAETHRPEEIIFIVAFADVVMGSRRHINPFSGPAQCLKALDEFHMADFFAAVDQVAWD